MFLPSEDDGHDSSTVLCNLQESGFSQVEVLEGRIAPPAVVVGQSEVRRAEVCRGDGDGAGEAPSRVIVAPHFVTSTTSQAIVEEGCAQSCSVGSIPLAVQVPVPASSSCKTQFPFSHTLFLKNNNNK